MTFGTSEVLPALSSWFSPLLGKETYIKKNVETATATANKCLSWLEKHLLTRTYLVGERVTAADFYLAGIVSKGFTYVFDKEWRKNYPNFVRWWTTIANQPSWAGKNDLVEEAIKYTPPAMHQNHKKLLLLLLPLQRQRLQSQRMMKRRSKSQLQNQNTLLKN